MLNSIRKEQSSGAIDKLSSLRSVQINPIDICNIEGIVHGKESFDVWQ
jgi:hypothetical protein|tara:strand:- start:3483 stop:3626 length:144 start_codon:yes stop_codon:yes gene_type:complete